MRISLSFESVPLLPVIWTLISVTQLSNVKSACTFSRMSSIRQRLILSTNIFKYRYYGGNTNKTFIVHVKSFYFVFFNYLLLFMYYFVDHLVKN